VTALCAALNERAMCVLLCICISTVYSTHTGCSDSEIHFIALKCATVYCNMYIQTEV
jgi:hypothetical protein